MNLTSRAADEVLLSHKCICNSNCRLVNLIFKAAKEAFLSHKYICNSNCKLMNLFFRPVYMALLNHMCNICNFKLMHLFSEQLEKYY